MVWVGRAGVWAGTERIHIQGGRQRCHRPFLVQRIDGRTMNLPKIIGHRGAAAHAPENTLVGLRKAAALGVTWVEFDVMLTQDRVPVMHHDHDLSRTAGLAQLVAHTHYHDLGTLDAGRWFHGDFAGETIPTLSQVFALLAELGLGANLEIKPAPEREAETAEVVVTVLKRNWPAELPPPLISSFQDRCLEVAKSLAPEIARGHLFETLPGDWQERVAPLDCCCVHPKHNHLDGETISAIQAAGYRVVTSTVNEPERAALLDGWGVDSIITDDPPAIVAALGN